jgi:hypothetical protein
MHVVGSLATKIFLLKQVFKEKENDFSPIVKVFKDRIFNLGLPWNFCF